MAKRSYRAVLLLGYGVASKLRCGEDTSASSIPDAGCSENFFKASCMEEFHKQKRAFRQWMREDKPETEDMKRDLQESLDKFGEAFAEMKRLDDLRLDEVRSADSKCPSH